MERGTLEGRSQINGEQLPHRQVGIASGPMVAKKKTENTSAIEEIISRASNPSRTLELARNYKHHGVYIFHGDEDKTVPVEQARFMREHLSKFHPDISYYEYPGGGHWFDQSVDWPPLFDYFKWHSVSKNNERETIEFHTASPGISSKNSWVEILQQSEQMEFASVTVKRDLEERTISGRTKNVSLLAFNIERFREADSITIELDNLNSFTGQISPQQTSLVLKKDKDRWIQGSLPPPSEKNPLRYGTLKYGMQQNMMFVYGTAGTEEENNWSYQKARYDAETWWYRGNGSVDILPDTAFDPHAEPDRSVILYGNRSSNAAWDPLLEGSPVQVYRDKVDIGNRSLQGNDMGIYFVRPRPNSEKASVVVIGGTGSEGMRTALSNRYFISGAGYPDLLVISSDMLKSGVASVKAAGFFGNDWSVENGEFAFQK